MRFKVSEICKINERNINKTDNYEFINYLDTSNLNEGRIDEVQLLEMKVDKIPSRAKRKIKKKDILISTVRPNQKHFGIINNLLDNLIASTGFVVLTADEEIVDSEYLYSYLTQESITNYLQAIAETSTSTYPSIKPSVIGELELELPSLPVQKAIAHILSTFDKKIEVNNQIIATLEEIASTLFKRWFIDFEFPDENGNPYKSSGGKMVESELREIPKGWSVIKVGDINVKISDYVANGSFASLKQNVTLYEEINYAYFVRNVDLKANVFNKFVDEHSYNFLSKTKLFGNEVIISNVGDVGSVFLCPILDKPMTLGNNIIMITSENKVNYNYFMYMLFKYSYGKDLIKSITGGSAQPKFNKTDFRSLKIVLPTDDVVVQFNALVEKLFELKNKNSSEITTLKIIRDTLLPKLLLGEIELPIEEEV